MAKNKDTFVQSAARAMIADIAARQSPRGSLAQKHAGQVALRYARQSMAIYRRNLFKKILVVCGMIVLVAVVVSNWP